MARLLIEIEIGDQAEGYPPGFVKEVLANGIPVEMDDRQNGTERVWFVGEEPNYTLYLTEDVYK